MHTYLRFFLGSQNFNFMKNLFNDQFKMETQTVFLPDGRVNTYPCSFELGRNITYCGDTAVQRGRLITECDGTSRFIPYRVSGKPRYTNLYRTASSTVKMSHRYFIVETRIPRDICTSQIIKHYQAEQAEVSDYLKTNEFFNTINPKTIKTK